MKFILCILSISIFTSAAGQRTYSDAEIKRLADLGRLWGMLHYFHPKMGTGEIHTDSLILSSAADQILDPSADGFKRSVNKMLGKLDDPNTYLQEKEDETPSLLFTPNPDRSVVHKLANDIWYMAFPLDCIRPVIDPFTLPGLIPAQWDSAKGIILDIRNTGEATSAGNATFYYNILPRLCQFLAGNTSVPVMSGRSIYHEGFVAQNVTASGSIYSSGWRSTNITGSWVNTTRARFNKPVVIVFNNKTNKEVMETLQALKVAGICKLVFEGALSHYLRGQSFSVSLTDSMETNIRISDWVTGKNQPVPGPDLHTELITDNSLDGKFVKQCIRLLEGENYQQGEKEVFLNMAYMQPKPGHYLKELLPSPEKRLYALYNWWNAIHYFFPYKKLIGRDWDSVLYQYIPRFLNANDTVSYNFALRAMVSEIKDSHGSFGGSTPNPAFGAKMGYWPPVIIAFVENKLIIVDKRKDSLQDMGKVEIWDEITRINGKPVSAAIEEWRYYFASSNESTYYRDVVRFLLSGSKNSTINLTINRNNISREVEMIRTSRGGGTTAGYNMISFNDNYSTVQMLEDNIGYVNMGNLTRVQVDSTMKAFENTRAIIFDIRNYPQGTARSIAPWLTNKVKTAVMFHKPLVTYYYLYGEEYTPTEVASYTVFPKDPGKNYKGKVIILCDQNAQSHSEYSIMIFQGAADVTVVGSQTAGADGNVSTVILPGGYMANFTGLGVLYPDGTETQRTGIRVDIQVKPTVEGLKKGKDEVIERALKYIKKGK